MDLEVKVTSSPSEPITRENLDKRWWWRLGKVVLVIGFFISVLIAGAGTWDGTSGTDMDNSDITCSNGSTFTPTNPFYASSLEVDSTGHYIDNDSDVIARAFCMSFGLGGDPFSTNKSHYEIVSAYDIPEITANPSGEYVASTASRDATANVFGAVLGTAVAYLVVVYILRWTIQYILVGKSR